MGALSVANMKKTIYYFQRNGLKNTWYAVRERLAQSKENPYVYVSPSKETLEEQRTTVAQREKTDIDKNVDFSIVVPLYRTKPAFLKELIESIQSQTYPYWEVILADATEDDSVRKVVETFSGVEFIENASEDIGAAIYGVIRYVHLSSNAGISTNTNAALPYARMNYIGLLDHDDILTPDALYEMAEAVREAKEQGREPYMIYSDEDKCNGDATRFYEPNYKENFNYDLILSNNYICHFLVMKRELMQKLRFRPAYDGAQDYDLVLRAVAELNIPSQPDREALVVHVPKVLYHWRCHEASTAENPRSKEYAYEAGRRALQDFIDVNGISGRVKNLKHVGFYQVEYPEDIFAARKDLGAVGGAIIKHGKIRSGRMDAEGKVFYEGLSSHFSGYLHRAVLTQSAEVLDIRSIMVREELHALFEKITGVAYTSLPGTEIFDASTLPADTDYKALSVKLCTQIRKEGYRLLWDRRENG